MKLQETDFLTLPEGSTLEETLKEMIKAYEPLPKDGLVMLSIMPAEWLKLPVTETGNDVGESQTEVEIHIPEERRQDVLTSVAFVGGDAYDRSIFESEGAYRVKVGLSDAIAQLLMNATKAISVAYAMVGKKLSKNQTVN